LFHRSATVVFMSTEMAHTYGATKCHVRLNVEKCRFTRQARWFHCDQSVSASRVNCRAIAQLKSSHALAAVTDRYEASDSC